MRNTLPVHERERDDDDEIQYKSELNRLFFNCLLSIFFFL